jgi:hypothetical protein
VNRGFINKLFNIRKDHPKGTPLNLLTKLLMNSLYGKYGMNPRMTEGILETSEMAFSHSNLPDDFILATSAMWLSKAWGWGVTP